MTRAEREKIRREVDRANRKKLLTEGRPEPYAPPRKKSYRDRGERPERAT